MSVTTAITDTEIMAALQRRNISIFWEVEPPADGALLTDAELITALATHSEPRFRHALIALFLWRPDYAGYVPSLVDSLPIQAADTLRHLYTAAAYLQRLWWSQIVAYLGDVPRLENYFGERHYGLVPLEEDFGELGLRQLAHHYQRQTGYNWLATYRAVVDLFRQLIRRRNP